MPFCFIMWVQGSYMWVQGSLHVCMQMIYIRTFGAHAIPQMHSLHTTTCMLLTCCSTKVQCWINKRNRALFVYVKTSLPGDELLTFLCQLPSIVHHWRRHFLFVSWSIDCSVLPGNRRLVSIWYRGYIPKTTSKLRGPTQLPLSFEDMQGLHLVPSFSPMVVCWGT